MKMIMHDLKVAVRNMMKYKVQTAVSVLSIAVGIVTLSFTHSLLNRFKLPFIYNESYYDRTYQLEFLSKGNGERVSIDNEIVRAIKKDGGPRCIEKITVPNGSPVSINANFQMADSSIRKGNIEGLIIDPGYSDYAGLRSAISGKKIRVLKAGEAIISEDYAKRIFHDKNPIGAVQIATKNVQPIPVTIVDVYESVSVLDSPIDNDALYYCISDDITELDFDETDYYAVWINVVLRKGFTKSQLEKEIEDCIKPLGLSLNVKKISDSDDIRMIKALHVIVYIIGSLILLAAIIGFMRIEIQLFRIRQRELSLRIVNGANRLRLFSLMFTEIFLSIIFAVLIAIILGILLQDFCDTKLNLIADNVGINIHTLWLNSLVIGGGLLAVCSIIAWIALSRIYRQGNRLAENMRRSRSHLFRNVMLGVQIAICSIFICSTFILIAWSNKILKESNIPKNDRQFKEYLYFEPMYASDKVHLLNEIKRLPDLDKIILCGKSYTSLNEIKESADAIEKLNRHTFFRSYFTDDTTLISKLGMNVEWLQRNGDNDNNMVLVSDKLYRKFKELGILSNNSLTIEAFPDKAVTFPIAGIIKSIAFDGENKSLVFISPNWEEAHFMQYLLIPKPKKGASLERRVDETVAKIEPELINRVVSNYRERVSPLPGFIEAVNGGGLILGCVSLLICAMSIFSSITLDTRSRKKDVAVRKVNGAKSRDIYRMFGKVYFILLVIAAIIVIPVSVMFNRIVMDILKEVTPDISLSPVGPIALGLAVMIGLISIIVGSQIRKTMKEDPAKIIAKE